MKTINQFLLENNLRIIGNPCISPDFCLDWKSLQHHLMKGQELKFYPKSNFHVSGGNGRLVSDEDGEHAWVFEWDAGTGMESRLSDGVQLKGHLFAYPATFENLLQLKNLVLEFDPQSTIFPTAAGTLQHTSIGVGARFTTLHWPAVEWTMSHLNLSLTANQNSIPRELIYDVDEMLAGKLDSVPFPFIGANVPEGHQGQSVQGMSQGAILSKLKNGFHHRRIPWGFNADHQPIGGKFDSREEKLVEGCALASYITFDLSPELAQTCIPETVQARHDYITREIPARILAEVKSGLVALGLKISDDNRNHLLSYVWPAMKKMERRDVKYQTIREKLFTTTTGRSYFRELSIDELPGLTTPETTAVMLLLCKALNMPIQYIAPAFGFQKNFPYPDNTKLHTLIEPTWNICKKLGVSIGFHSGSGKSEENYRLMGEITGGHLEIKTSGRYTYEMGVALSISKNAQDQKLWNDWYDFTRKLACEGAFSTDATEQKMARQFIVDTLAFERRPADVFTSPEKCREALSTLKPHPDHMYWFEYNFLFVLAADGRAEKATLGDHSIKGYRQRARFYNISNEARLNYSRRVARYLLFLAESAELVDAKVLSAARKLLGTYTTQQDFENGIVEKLAMPYKID